MDFSILVGETICGNGQILCWVSRPRVWHIFSHPFKDLVLTWDLNLSSCYGLWALDHLLFTSLKPKDSFPITVMLARRASELEALMAGPPYTVFFKDKVALWSHPKLLIKVVSVFHLNQPVYLLVFLLKPHSGLRTFDVWRALAFCLDRTKPFSLLIFLSPVLIAWKVRQCQRRWSLHGLPSALQQPTG